MEKVAQRKLNLVAIGFAIFSMFFGAGNIVFPLILGEYAQDRIFFGISGMMITAVLVPLIGMLGMILYQGDYNAYFRRIGKIPGMIMVVTILALIGPFAGIPRCITISYATLTAFGIEALPGVNLVTFSLFSCAIIFACTIRPARLLDLLGKVLTPILIGSLALIAVKGLCVMPHIGHASDTALRIFSRGFAEGYNTMDLLASFFFSSVIMVCMRERQEGVVVDSRRFFTIATLGALIAALLLSVVYLSFSTLAAGYHGYFAGVPNHEMLGAMARQVLGPYAGLIVGVTVFFAVLTTMIALTTIFSKFLQETVFKNKISYPVALAMTLAVAFGVSTLHFDGISRLIGPVLQVCYPALIVLAFANLLGKFYDFKLVRPLFYGTLAVTAVIRYLA